MMVNISDCCQNCGKGGSQLQRCKHCKVVFYCSEICEMEDRVEHSKVCSVKNVASANADLHEQNIKFKKEKKNGNAKKNNNGADDSNNTSFFFGEGGNDLEFHNDMVDLSNPYGFIAGPVTRPNNPPFICSCCGSFKLIHIFCKICRFISYCSELCLLRDYPAHRLVCIPFDKHGCARCRRSDVELTKCSGCNQVEYCSKFCESVAWEYHKLSCKSSKTKDGESSSKILVKGQCARCKKSDVALKKCVACNNVEYCSQICQTADWKHHKTSCKTAKTADGESSSKTSVKGQCGKCKRSNVKLTKCTNCTNIEYCSEVCQIDDWPDHRKSCQISESKGQCANCTRSMRKCSGCQSVEYCSEECQSAHWKHHKTSCKASKTVAEDSSSEKSVKSQCARCKKSDVALRKCSRCNNVEYCSDVCQEADKKHHETSCKTAKTADGESSSKMLINERCQRCKIWNDNLKRCTGCYKVKYCSKYCQESDWIYHKQICNNSTDNKKGSTFPIPKSIDKEIARMFPFQTVLTKFDEVTAVDRLPLTHTAKVEKLIAYIAKKGYHPFRLHHEIRDVVGEIRHVMFYLKEFVSEPYFSWDQLKVGNYIVIIKPQIHYFIDGNIGFRINSVKEVRFIDNNSH